VALQPALVVGDAETLVTAAAWVVIAAVTDWLLERHPMKRQLIPVLADWEREPGAIYFVTPSLRLLPAKTKSFIAVVAEQLRR